MKPVRLGLIGCGAWGWRYVPSALEAGNAEVTHLSGHAGGRILGCDPEMQLSRIHQIVPSRDWRKLLDAPVDAFIVATPPDSHEDIVRTLLDAGRPVMVEKPVALDLGAAIRMMIAAKKAGVPYLVNHQHLFAPAYEELLRIASGWKSVAASSAGGALGPTRSYSALWDYGPHDVAMHIGLADAVYIDDEQDFRVVAADRGGGCYRFGIERPGVSSLVRVWNDRQPKARGFVAIGSEGMLVYDDLDPEGWRLRFNGSSISVSSEKPLTRSIRAFAYAVQKGSTRDWRFSADLGVEVTRILATVDERIGPL